MGFRWAYHGNAFWKLKESAFDVLIIILCVGATVTEHIPGMKADQAEVPHSSHLNYLLVQI